MAAQNTFGTFDGVSQLTIDSNFVFEYHGSILKYSKKKIGDIMPNNDGSFNNHIIENWYNSEFSKSIKSKFEKVRSKIPESVVNWEFTVNDHEENEFGVFKWTASNTTRGKVMEGGLLGLLKNLSQFISLAKMNQFAKTSGSGSSRTKAYTINIKRLMNATRTLMRDLSLDTTLKMLNNQKLKLYNPSSSLVYCGAQVLEHAMKIHAKDKFIHNIPDEAINEKGFIQLIKRFIDNKWLLKKVMIWKLRKYRDVHKLELLYPDKKPVKHEKNVEFVIKQDGSHIWVKEKEIKRKRVDVESKCHLCNEIIEESYFDRHLKSCEIAFSRKMDNIHCKQREYSITKYTIEMLENMESERTHNFNMAKQELINGRSVYLTGPGGNGKTHLVKELLFNIPGFKKVLSPTGIAASEYKDDGSTWQKLFLPNLILQHKPFDYLLKKPDEFKQLVFQYLENKWEKKPKFLVLEECSMIRAIDCRYISECLKILFDDDRIFGGIPMLICGDPAQLEPVDENDGLADLYFTDETISEIRRYGCVIKMNHPRRLLKSGISNDEVIDQFNILQNLRNSILTPEFFNKVDRITPNDFFDLLRNGHFERNTDDIVLTPSNERNRYLLFITQDGQNLEKVGLNYQGNDFFIKKGMKLIVRDNQTVNSKSVVNGTPCWVVDWKVDKWIKIRIKGGKEFKVNRGKGSIGMNTNRFALEPFFIRTVHLAQGCTIEGKLFFYGQSDYHSISSNWGAGHIYTLFSRVTNLKNIVFVCGENKKLNDVVKDKYCWTYKPVLDVINNPRAEIAINTMVGEDGKLALRDSNSIEGYYKLRDRRILNKEGHHADRYMTENEMRYDNSVIYDHETREVDKMGLKKHEIGFSTLIWTFNGKLEYFDEFIIRNGGDIDDLEMFEKDNGKMIFDDQYMDNAGDSIYDWLTRLFYLIGDKFDEHERDDWSKDMKSELALLLRNPLRLIGFNNLGFDDRFFMEYALRKDLNLEPAYIQGNGANLKQFALAYANDPKKRIAMRSWDLSLIIGVGSLDAHIKSSVMKNVNNPSLFMTINSRLWIYGITPYNDYIFGDNFNQDDWRNLDATTKKNIIKIWTDKEICQRHFQCSDQNLKQIELDRALKSGHYFVERCEIAGQRDEILLSDLETRDKKGCCALKLYTKLAKNDNHQIDLIDYMTDENGELDFSRAFFDPKKGRELLKEKGEDFFRNYNVHKEMREYGINDTVVTLLLMAIKDNSMAYSSGHDSPEFQFKDSWGGIGLSLLRFDTTCQYSMFNTFARMSKEALFLDGDKQYFNTKFPTMPIEAANDIKNICGGKTQARRIHFQAPLDENGMPRLKDCMTYPDVSGMYMRIQEITDYPYGRPTIWTHVFQDKLDKLADDFNNDDPELWKKCRIFVFIGQGNPKETENVGGVKRNGKLLYTNEEIEYTMTNYELEIFRLYKGTIKKIKRVTEWEFQGKLFQAPMQYYTMKKNTAKDPLERNNAKLCANSSFGALNQKDKNCKMVVMNNADDVHRIHDLYPSGIKDRREINGKLIGHVEDTEVTNHYKPSYIGAFTLGASKRMLYKILYIAVGGDERFDDLRNMIGYGDTDSLTMLYMCLQRLVDHDIQVEEEYRILFNPGDDKKLKAGKLTNELADDIGNYFDDGRENEYHKSFGTQTSDFQPFIVEIFNPASKSGGVKIIAPPIRWPDGRLVTKDDCPTPQQVPWDIGYKCFAKGVSKYAELEVLDEERNVHLKIEKIGYNKETYELLKHAYRWSIPIKTKRKESIMKRVLFTNSMQEDEGMCMFGIYNIEDPGRTIWGYPNNGRIVVMNPGYEGRSVQEWARLGVDAFECSEGYTVPYGFEFD